MDKQDRTGRMCDPSTAPAHWGKPSSLSNPSTTSLKALPTGNRMYWGSSTLAMAEHTSLTAKQTVDFETPKRCPMVRKSAPVARNHRVRATRWSVGTAFLISVSCLSTEDRNLSHMYEKVSRDIRKFSSQSCGVSTELMKCSHQ